jgi:hypothetical protein
MKKNIFLFCLFFFTISVNASTLDYLQPIESVFTDFCLDYHTLIKETLFKNLSRSPIARTMIEPSFEQEYLVTIEYKDSLVNDSIYGHRNLHSRNIYLIYRTCTPSCQKVDFNKKNAFNIISKEIIVDSTFAYLIEDAYNCALFQSKFHIIPRNHAGYLSKGFDGTIYYYTTTNLDSNPSGQVWSPREGTKMYDLTIISELLRKFAETKQISIKKQIISKSKQLIQRYENEKIPKHTINYEKIASILAIILLIVTNVIWIEKIKSQRKN